MRIAIVCDYFLDFVGGAQTSMRQQELALTAAGHEVVMISASRFSRPRVSHALHEVRLAPVATLPGLELPVIVNSSRTRATLRAAFRERAVDVVHVQTEFGLAHAAVDVARELGIPVVHTVHTFYWASDGPWWHRLVEPLLRRSLERITRAEIPASALSPRPIDNLLRNLTLGMARRVDAVISPSAHQARDLADARVETAIDVVPNPITSPTTPVDALGADREPRFLWVARCEPIKRPLPFAEAAVRALEITGGGFSVDFVGDGSDRAALEKLVEGHPLVHVHGALDHERVLELMNTTSIVVLTSVGFDNQPMTIAEAVSRQRGILYCDPKLREGLLHAGHLAPSPDVAGLTAAIVDLVQTPGLIEQLSRGAAQDGEQFLPESYAESFASLATRVRNGHRPV
ncbi:glycosyltransferase family 4 protein [Marisediminicola sp. LYQ85]|uniref:glycosyltransferase family 4 protein n=1 Tax=Marisediminicola sp. LYQ85 TaxID=3391062 RepID=UPI003983D2F3